ALLEAYSAYQEVSRCKEGCEKAGRMARPSVLTHRVRQDDYSHPIMRGSQSVISGTKVIISRKPNPVSSQGMVDLVTSVSPSLDMLEATYRFRPTGGVARPISMFTTSMMPKCTGSMPSFMATGNRMGAMIRIRPEGS